MPTQKYLEVREFTVFIAIQRYIREGSTTKNNQIGHACFSCKHNNTYMYIHTKSCAIFTLNILHVCFQVKIIFFFHV